MAVHFPVPGNMAQEQALIRQRQPLPQPGNVRPQRVDDGLPAVRVPGRCLPDVPDQAGKAGRAQVRHLEDGWLEALPGGAWCSRGTSPCRDTACTTVCGCAPVRATATSSMVRPVPRMTTGLPSATLSRAPGRPGVADVARRSWHRERRGGRLVAGGQHGRVRVDAAPGRQVQPQRQARSARGQSHNVRGNPGDGGGWACHPLRVGEQLAQVAAELRRDKNPSCLIPFASPQRARWPGSSAAALIRSAGEFSRWAGHKLLTSTFREQSGRTGHGQAARESGQRWPLVQYSSMCSSGRPLVSGRKRQTKMMARPAKMA